MDFEYWEEQQQKRKAQAPPTPTEPARSTLTGTQRLVTSDGTPHLQPAVEEPSLDNAVPAELKALPQWVMWRDGERDGKLSKIPCEIPKGNRLPFASTAKKDRQTWTDYKSVIQHVDKIGKIFIASERIPNSKPKAYHDVKRALRGIGFVFTTDDPYTGIDLDNCLNEDATVKEWAREIVNVLKEVCYWEVSPSGTGLKFWTRARLPFKDKKGSKEYLDKDRGEAIEIYDHGRFFTVTGDKGQGTINDGQHAVYELCDQYLKLRPKPTRRKPSPLPANSPGVDEVLRLANKAQNAYKFNQLLSGNITLHGSHSEADAALCAIIAFYSPDPKVIDTIFRSSGLIRDKWDEKHSADSRTYGEMTIGFVLDNLTETYTPPENSRHTGRNHNRQRWGQRSWEQQRRFERRAF